MLSFTSLCRPGCSFLWEGDALPFHVVAVEHSPFVAVGDFGDGRAVLLLVGVQHEVALGGIECVISGMTGGSSVLKNGVTLYTAATIYINEISGCGGFYPGEAVASRYDITAEPGTHRYFEHSEARTSVESIMVYGCHIIQRECGQ